MMRETNHEPQPERRHLNGAHSKNRKHLLIWVGLIGFVLGTAICAFNPTNTVDLSDQAKKESENMTFMNNLARSQETKPLEQSGSSRIETATFAMG